MIASTFHYPPSVILNQQEEDGLEVRIIKLIANTMNFKITFQKPRDGQLWGNRMENGSYSGKMVKPTKKCHKTCILFGHYTVIFFSHR